MLCCQMIRGKIIRHACLQQTNHSRQIAKTWSLSAPPGSQTAHFSSGSITSGSAKFFSSSRSKQRLMLEWKSSTVALCLCWRSTTVTDNLVLFCIMCIFCIFYIFCVFYIFYVFCIFCIFWKYSLFFTEWVDTCQSTMVYEHRESAQVLYICSSCILYTGTPSSCPSGLNRDNTVWDEKRICWLSWRCL